MQMKVSFRFKFASKYREALQSFPSVMVGMTKIVPVEQTKNIDLYLQ